MTARPAGIPASSKNWIHSEVASNKNKGLLDIIQQKGTLSYWLTHCHVYNFTQKLLSMIATWVLYRLINSLFCVYIDGKCQSQSQNPQLHDQQRIYSNSLWYTVKSRKSTTVKKLKSAYSTTAMLCISHKLLQWSKLLIRFLVWSNVNQWMDSGQPVALLAYNIDEFSQ